MEEIRNSVLPDEYEFNPCGLGMALAEDVAMCLREGEGWYPSSLKTEFWRRMLVRSVFADIEANTSIMRRVIIEIYAMREERRIPITKVALLHDYEYQPDEVGVVRRQTQKMVTVKQIALTIRTFAEVTGQTEEFIQTRIFGDNHWNNLKKSIKVRDRLTHPKKDSDLIVSDEEKEVCVNAHQWFVMTMHSMMAGSESVTKPYKYVYEENRDGMTIVLNHQTTSE